MVWRLGLFCIGSFCLVLSALSPLCILCSSSAPWSCSSVSACICFWWLGCECGIYFTVFHITWKQTLKCWVWLVIWSVCAYLCFFFFLAWLICMLLAGSCPNRGCHLIKSIICWLNLLELRRKRSVHTFTQSAYFSSVSNSLPPMKYTHTKKILCPAIRDPVATAYSWNGQCGRTTSRNYAVFFFLLRTNNGARTFWSSAGSPWCFEPLFTFATIILLFHAGPGSDWNNLIWCL